jgi:holo-[acyl-carrier protein] synthase
MIIGLGEDLVDIKRIEKLIADKGDRFLEKCFTPSEIDKATTNHKSHDRYVAYFAKRFAAKEACLKALGTGMRDGLFWHDMDISNDALGRPILTITGGVEAKLIQLANGFEKTAIHITLSDESHLAKATVILEGV